MKARHNYLDYAEGQAYHPHTDIYILLRELDLVLHQKFRSGPEYFAALPMQHHQPHLSGSTVFQQVPSTCFSLSNLTGCHTTYTGLGMLALQNVNSSVIVVITNTAGI